MKDVDERATLMATKVDKFLTRQKTRFMLDWQGIYVSLKKLKIHAGILSHRSLAKDLCIDLECKNATITITITQPTHTIFRQRRSEVFSKIEND